MERAARTKILGYGQFVASIRIYNIISVLHCGTNVRALGESILIVRFGAHFAFFLSPTSMVFAFVPLGRLNISVI